MLKIPLRAVLYREDENWYAHCLEFDLIGDGATMEEALQSLSQTINVQIDTCVVHRTLESLFRPADGKYFQMFAAGKTIPAAPNLGLRDRDDNLEIERFDAREYDNTIDLHANLALA